jgi:hypothetical protein
MARCFLAWILKGGCVQKMTDIESLSKRVSLLELIVRQLLKAQIQATEHLLTVSSQQQLDLEQLIDQKEKDLSK